MKSILDPDGLKSRALGVAQLGFALSLGWIIERSLSWWAAILVSAAVSVVVSGVLRRRSTGTVVFLQEHRGFVSAGTILAIPAGVLLARFGDHSWFFRGLSTTAVSLGLVLGFEIRRSGAHALAPEVPEFGARGRKARFFLTLALALPPFRELRFPDALMYGCALSVGVLAHATLRIIHRRAQLPVQKIGAARKALTVPENEELEALLRPRIFRARRAGTATHSFAGQMIAAVRGFEAGSMARASEHLDEANRLAPDNRERAKAIIIQAAIFQALGKEAELEVALRKVRELYGECPVATVAEIVFAADNIKSRQEAEQDLIRLLRAEANARSHSETVVNILVGRIFGVNRALFMVAKARAYFQMGNLGESGAILGDVLSCAPRLGLARLHQGMVFVAKRARAKTDAEKGDYYDIAVIQFELAIRYSPDGSVTSKRAAEQLRRLHDSMAVPRDWPGGSPQPT